MVGTGVLRLMGWNNPPIPWRELERRLSGRAPPKPPAEREPPPAAAPAAPNGPVTPYAELHCHSNFSFLDGTSDPEELVTEASRLGLSALALTDHDGLYGVARLAEAAAAAQLPTVFGAELSLGLSKPQNGVPDPEGDHLLVLARGKQGYHRLAAAITAAAGLRTAPGTQTRAEKGRPVYDLEDLAARADGHWLVLTGCRKGAVPRAVRAGDADAAARELDRLVALFGRDHVAVELTDHGDPLDTDRGDALAELAQRFALPTLATNNVHYAAPEGRRLATAFAAVRARRSLPEMDGWLAAAGTAHLRSGAEMAARFDRYPGAVARTVEYARALAFPLTQAQPQLPLRTVPTGYSPMGWLRTLTYDAAAKRYGSPEERPDAYHRLDHELAVIEQKDFPGYFLIVHEIVSFARDHGILCQGRGSAAASAVCYVLGITAVDAVAFGLPFERFLATNRDEEPDIDVDFDAERREEVIQHVYDTYGRENAAQVADVITYRSKMAVRDMAKALGYATGQQDAWSKQVGAWGELETGADTDIPEDVLALAREARGSPRHLGIHSGGMVLTRQPIGEVCPIEWARMTDRSVLQWDKDDCEYMHLVKFDLLGLGMLAALNHTFTLLHDHLGVSLSLDTIPKEEAAVYDMLGHADTVGVFQVESRAQMATLPRLRPRKFYDLAIEVALIRPGPIQGGAVHPLIRRKLGSEPVDCMHPALEPVLERTLGVPLFQEQLMQIAMTVGGCTGDDADLLRRAMGSKRGQEKISALRQKLYDGMHAHGIEGARADEIYAKIESFANFGFAESHAISFALLVYASSWLRLHYPAAFLAALLRAQPMGFYSPQTLVADARRHGVEVRRPDIQRSGVHATLEDCGNASTGDPSCVTDPVTVDRAPPFDPDTPVDHAAHRQDGRFACRLGLAGVTSVGQDAAARIVAERAGGPYADMADLARRTGLSTAQLEALATAGAFCCFGLSRRQALWTAAQAAQEGPSYLVGTSDGTQAPQLPVMLPAEQTTADLWATGVATEGYPTRHIRTDLDARGVIPAVRLRAMRNGQRVATGGVVTHRQRPSTARGVTFLNLEDETGMINVICPLAVWNRHLRTARDSPALVIHGRLERAEGVTNLLAERIERLDLRVRSMSRDFQ